MTRCKCGFTAGGRSLICHTCLSCGKSFNHHCRGHVFAFTKRAKAYKRIPARWKYIKKRESRE